MTTTSASEVDGIQIEEALPEFLRIPPSDIQIGEQIGQGGFARVHKASWNGIQCAAKIVQSANVLVIQREVAILSKLQHPNVIRCIGFSVDSVGDPRRCMILMELLDTDLRELMNELLKDKDENALPFNKEEALDILRQIAAGMEYLHGLRVFHGDLKASNILVSRSLDGKIHVKITDFGVSQMAKLDAGETSVEFMRKKYFRGAGGTRGYQAPEVSSSSSTHVSNWIGTRRYQAPEDSRPKRGKAAEEFYTAKADVYCFAMTCYEILSGHVPFESVRKADIPKLVLGGARPEFPHGVYGGLVFLLHDCWNRKPRRRPKFSTIGVLLQGFSKIPISKELLLQTIRKEPRYKGLLLATFPEKPRSKELLLQTFPKEPRSKDLVLQTLPEQSRSKRAPNCWGRLLSRFCRGMQT